MLQPDCAEIPAPDKPPVDVLRLGAHLWGSSAGSVGLVNFAMFVALTTLTQNFNVGGPMKNYLLTDRKSR